MENTVYHLAKKLSLNLEFSHMGGRPMWRVEKDGGIYSFRGEGQLRAWLEQEVEIAAAEMAHESFLTHLYGH